MARIELSFQDKKYTIEYNRASIKEFIAVRNKGSDFDKAVALIKCGLLKHHSQEMPDDDAVLGWVMAMGEDLKDFIEALQGLIQDALNVIKADRKNLKWEKVA